ncbi:MAG: hypothetical protein KC416_11110, partial [Myxococcales bacterium]|nr:hypothetical protein [Myxococcales bacterium]
MRLCFLLWLAAAAGFLTACNERAGAPIAPTGRTGGGAGEEDAGKKQDATVAMPEPEEDAGAGDAGADAGPTPSCAVDNGGCGDAMYWACSDTGGTIECADINECDADNGGCGDAAHWACTNNEGAAPTCADIN